MRALLLREEFGINPYSPEYRSLPTVDKVIARSRWEAGCLIFYGERSPEGYGRIRHDGRKVFVHRFMWEQLVEPVASGLQIDHLCRNAPCWFSDHLRIVTGRVNSLASTSPAAWNARKTHCHRGHPFSGPNLRIEPSGRRVCRTCKRERRR